MADLPEEHPMTPLEAMVGPVATTTVPTPTPAAAATAAHAPLPAVVFDIDDLAVYYGAFKAVRNVTLAIRQHEITAFIGPSGCGKTTVLRCFNRMNDLVPTARVEGSLL